jgi:hypothetical protein
MLDQPSILSVIQRLRSEIGGAAAFLLDERGQIHHCDSKLSTDRWPALGALVAGLIGAGQSVAEVGGSEDLTLSSSADRQSQRMPHSFSCDSEDLGIYTVRLGTSSLWLAALYDQPMNPGRTRLRIRRAAWDLAELVEATALDEADLMGHEEPLGEVGTKIAGTSGGISAPVTNGPPPIPANNTRSPEPLFDSLTDDEVDSLFSLEKAQGRNPH